MLAVACNRPIGADTLVHIEAAAAHWNRGDKALANLRLVFANLPRLEDPADAYRLCLAEHLLDEGMTPGALLREMGLAGEAADFAKFREDEPRVPAGHHRDSGRWTRGDGSFDVATEEGPSGAKRPPETEEERKAKDQVNVGNANAGGPGGPVLNPSSDMISGAGTGDGPLVDRLPVIAKHIR